MMDSEPDQVVQKGTVYDQRKKAPIPPSIENIAGNQQEDVLDPEMFVENPIYNENDGKKYKVI
jgi:hypothetical protein